MHIGSQKMMESSEQTTAHKLLSGTEVGQDSGFLSGALTTESDLAASACDLEASCSKSNLQQQHQPQQQSARDLTDSGLDVSFSNLNLTEEVLKSQTFGKSHTEETAVQTATWEQFYTPDDDGDTKLHLAIMHGRIDLVNYLISLVPHPSILDFENDECQTALHLAVLTKQARIARWLVVAGASVDKRDRYGNCAIHIAAQNGDMGCIQALCMAVQAQELQERQFRYQPFAQTSPQHLDSCNYDGQAPIHLASSGGHCDVIRALKWLGANVNQTENKAGRSSLHLAAEHGHLAAVRVLVGECGVDPECETYAGYTSYQLVSEVPDMRLANELVRLGAVPLSGRMDDSDSDSDVPL